MTSQEEYEKSHEHFQDSSGHDWPENPKADDRIGTAIAQENSSTDVEDLHALTNTWTSRSTVREPRFEPINAGDRQELHRIASSIGRPASLVRTATSHSSALERKDTLAGVDLGDAVLDPNSPEFDAYKWARM